MRDDIRWIQRFNNFKKALRQLDDAVEIVEQRALSPLEEQGVIQAFEYNYELAWKTLKDFYEYQGEKGIQGSRDTIRIAFQRGLICDGDLWFAMVQSRILTSHTYNEELTEKILLDIFDKYYDAFHALKESFEKQLTKPESKDE